ncbi:MAG: hypothetical protein O3A36_00670 [bacterium]|nr:hypothetical protein [bacterium]
MYTFFLGTNSDLSTAEITAVLNRHGISFTIISSQKQYIRIQTQSAIPLGLVKILGGTIRISQDVAVWDTMPATEEILTALQPLPPKWQVGLGCIGMSLNIRKLGIELKKGARAQDSRLAFIEPKAGTVLNAAQVIFNKLTSLPNAELIFIQENEKIILVRTTSIQDIASYELRDTLRPARDARIGLLPPKLAQIMINLALPQDAKKSTTIYDPFCGMGTVLQEAWLMKIASFGTDISEDMVAASTKNIAHLEENFSVQESLKPQVFHHDATSPNFPEEAQDKNLTVVTEPFLGTPLTRALSPIEGTQFYESVMPLYRQFFMNIKSVLQENARLLVLLPAVRIRENGKDTFTPLPRTFLDEIITFGYRNIKLIPEEKPLLYARPDALIAREFTLWERV